MTVKPFRVTQVEKICDDTQGGPELKKHLELKKATYIDKSGNEAQWSYCTRPKSSVVTLACHTEDGRFAIIRQPRVPLSVPTASERESKIVWSFPAGLTEGETIGTTALNELRQETGYDFEKELSRSPPLPKSAGMSDEINTLVECKLGKAGAQELEATELIGVHLMTPQQVIDLQESLDPEKEVISSGLWSYMKGYTRGVSGKKN